MISSHALLFSSHHEQPKKEMTEEQKINFIIDASPRDLCS